MKTVTCFLCACALSAPLFAESRNAISQPAVRRATLKLADSMLASRTAAVGALAELKDPLYPSQQDLNEDYDPNAPKPVVAKRGNDEEVLQAVAKQIQPTGNVVLGGEPYLLFGERRQKIGDKVTVTFEGIEYLVEIVSIENKSFRLRYNNAEMVKSIK